MEATDCINCTHGGLIDDSGVLIDDRIKNILSDILFIGAGTFISLFGIISNIISIAVYVKLGVKDSATVQFLGLSASDCVFSVLVLMSSVSIFFSQIKPDLTMVDSISFMHLVSATREKTYSVSMCIIFIMSLERCFCVAYPFTIKLIFTRARSAIVISCISIILVVVLIPEYLTKGLTWTFDNKLNTSRLMYWSTRDYRAAIEVGKNAILAGLLPLGSGVTVTICTLYMISAMQASSKFRQRAVVDKCREASSKEKYITKGIKSSEPKTHRLKTDARVTRTVIAVAIVFILCNIPKCIVVSHSVVVLYIPDFSLLVEGRYQNLISVLFTITFIFEALNGASTFIIYYAFSTKFKTALQHTLRTCINDT
ncbi:hypothetical protein BsWGS_12788 [Bradybaena similaris]